MFSRLGPAPAPLVCVLLILVVVAVGYFVPIGRPSRTMDGATAFGMLLGAATLGLWALALVAQAWWLSGVEGKGVILVPAASPGVTDLLFSLPFLVVVPVAGGGLFTALRGGGLSLATLVSAVVFVALCAQREVDMQGYVHDGVVTARQGWLWPRRTELPVREVRDVVVREDSFRHAPSYVVELSLSGRALPGFERRFRVRAEADAEAGRWRAALGPLRGAP